MVQVGARWWKFDFHTHTPASIDYGRSEPILRETVSPKEWLKPFVDLGIECVAVTDHNTGAWIECLQVEAQALRDEGKIIYIFPGVEITANGNIHILAIFDPSKKSETIQALVGAVRYRGEPGNSDAVAEESAENIVAEIIASGGVAIPAHVDLKAGMCQVQSAHTISQICSKASALEVIFPQGGRGHEHDELLKRYKSLNSGLAEVIGSDAHRPDEVGRAFTWVKMSTPTIDGLRLALVDGSSSVKRSETVKVDPNAVSSNVIHSISIANAKYCGRGKPLDITFNPWLNSIIGGRGSGKSSILEFLRLGLGRDKDILDIPGRNEIKDTFSRFAQKSVGRDADGVLLDKTVIKIVFQKDGAYYLLEWVSGSGSVLIHKWDGAAWSSENGDARSRFPIKIFSQKQIYDIAKNPSALIRIIDETDVVDMFGWKMAWDEKESRFLSVCGHRRVLQGQVANKNILEGQLADVVQKISVIEASGHATVLSNFNLSRSKAKAIDEFKVSYSALGGKWSKVMAETEALVLDTSVFDSTDVADFEMLGRVGALSEAYLEFKANIALLMSGMAQHLNDFQVWESNSNFTQRQRAAAHEYSLLVETLTRNGVSNPDEYQQLVQLKSDIEVKLAEIKGFEIQEGLAVAEINLIYSELIELRKSLTAKRNDFIKQHLSGSDAINLAIQPLCNIDDMEISFRGVIGRPDSAFSSDILDKEKEAGFLYSLWMTLTAENHKMPSISGDLSSNFALIHDFKTQLMNYTCGSVMGSPIGKRFHDFMAQLQPHDFDQINLWFPDDQLVVKFNDGKRYRDIAQGSAGQKAATVLSFLLSYGTEPLILDQPEDDLDNGLISSLIVSKLQENKSRRQVIVVTHNPNIVVNGDSEYVIALQDKGNIEVAASGGLQELSVRREVCEIMEGGKQALEQRYRRMITV
ncbi:AAA family ATPase [Pseudomonas alliivorans]|nr:AAA family ATPase [Pseudomonas alliivorans]MEE4700269.1 AAA family ATPase [Pseudomonas alliivorans]MEE4736248.1 AAA family ATPase [Pseudomonas alliivorans]